MTALAVLALCCAVGAVVAGVIALISAALVAKRGHEATRRQLDAWERRARFERGASFREH